jgi:signal transduction histidine kinase/ligand-binding sensor domain-containing protein
MLRCLCRTDAWKAGLTLLGLFCMAAVGHAQELPVQVRRIGLEQGLPSLVITSLAEDQQGLLWIGSIAGLARFDGSAITVFGDEKTGPSAFPYGTVRDVIVTRDDAVWAAVDGGGVAVVDGNRTGISTYRANPDSDTDLPSNRVTALMEDSRGRVWTGMHDGLVAVLDRDTHAFTAVQLVPENIPSGVDYAVWSFAEGPDGRVWVGTGGATVHVVDPDTFESMQVPLHFDPEGATTRIRALIFLPGGELWIGSFGAGIIRMDPRTFAFRPLTTAGSRGHVLSSNDVRALALGPNGAVWAATYGGGVNRIDPSTGRVDWIRDQFGDPRTSEVLPAREGSFWVGSWGGGLSMLSATPSAFLNFAPGMRSGLEGRDVTAIVPALDGRSVWITTYDDALHHLDLETLRVEPSPVQPFQKRAGSPQLMRVLETRDGSLFVGSLKGGVEVLAPGADTFEPLAGDFGGGADITALHQDAGGRVWIGTRAGLGVVDAPGQAGLAVTLDFVERNPSVRSITSTEDGTLLVATTAGVAGIDSSTQTGRWLFRGEQLSIGATTTPPLFRAMAVGPDGAIWMGFEGGGLVTIESTESLLTGPPPRFRIGVGGDLLPSTIVQGLQFDREGMLWVSTSGGLARLDPRAHTVRSFFRTDGLVSDAWSSESIALVGEMLLVGSRHGFTTFDARKLPPEGDPPTVVATGVRRVVGSDVSFDPLPGIDVTIPWGRGTLLFDFSVVDLQVTEPSTYEYSLGGEDAWTPLGSNRTVAFASDRPGTYDLVARARTARGQLALESRPIRIVVVPPWWMTVWGRVLIVGLFLGSVYGFNRFRTARMRGHTLALLREVKERKRAESDRDLYEEQFRQAQKLEAVGKLTGGLAHDFNNILTVIQGSLELLAEDRPEDEEVQRRTEDALHAANQASVLTRGLLSFSRKQVLRPSSIDLVVVAERLEGLLRPTLGEIYDLTMSIPADVWALSADSAHLESAVLNLVLNARDAQPDGGVIALQAANRTLTEAEARDLDLEGAEGLFTHSSRRDLVAFSVSDQGTGMDADTRTRALDPFFTTKGVGKGSGLGLSMVYGFVRQSAGLFTLESAPGEGTTITVYFPRELASAPVAGVPTSPPAE